MIDAIALAKAAKDEDEFQQEQEKKKPFILKVLKAIWKFIICDRAFFILSRENFIRRFACWFCTWGPFEWFILATILDNSIGHFYRKMKGKWSCCLAVAEVAPPRQPLKFAWNHRYNYDSFFIKDEMPDSQP